MLLADGKWAHIEGIDLRMLCTDIEKYVGKLKYTLFKTIIIIFLFEDLTKIR